MTKHTTAPVVCHHPLFSTRPCSTPLASAGEGRIEVVAPELLGQVSRVHDVRQTVTMDPVTDDVLKTIDELGLERSSVVGQSMGGDVATRIAARRPAAIERIVLLGLAQSQEGLGHVVNISSIAGDCNFYGQNIGMFEIMLTFPVPGGLVFDRRQPAIEEAIRALPSKFSHLLGRIRKADSFARLAGLGEALGLGSASNCRSCGHPAPSSSDVAWAALGFTIGSLPTVWECRWKGLEGEPCGCPDASHRH